MLRIVEKFYGSVQASVERILLSLGETQESLSGQLTMGRRRKVKGKTNFLIS